MKNNLNLSDKRVRKIICGSAGQDAMISSAAAAEKEKIKMACAVNFVSHLY